MEPLGTDIHVPPANAPLGPVRAFLHRQRDDLVRDAILGLVLAICAFGLAAYWDGRMADRQERLEEARALQQEVLENTRSCARSRSTVESDASHSKACR